MVSTLDSVSEFRALFNAANDAIWILDGDVITDCNATAQDLLQCPPDELIGSNFLARLTSAGEYQPASPLPERRLLEAAVAGAPQRFEWQYSRLDGASFYLEVSLDRVELPTGTYVQAVARDITERKQMEVSLRERERRFRALFEGANDAIMILDRETIIDCNNRTLELFGLSRKQLIGSKPYEYSYDRQPDGVTSTEKGEGKIEAAMAGEPQRFEWKHLRHDGSTFDVDVSLKLVELPSGKYIQTIVRDITRLKDRERQLKVALAQLEELNSKIEAENVILREEVDLAHVHGNLATTSVLMQSVIRDAQQVAETNSTVLILGETGTGKELLARAIHSMSSRNSHPLVVVNCAAMPATLVESELFGREAGAYTGASTRQIGRFEVADASTIFLDEVGELPLETQAKLLRVLQEGEIQRLGGTKTISVDTRVVAATNRDLADEVARGRFRDDLFYRLNVYPITIPPLRDRREDIEPLVNTFVSELEQSMGRRISRIERKGIESMQHYSWPGNVRELRNVVERSMIQCKEEVLRIQVPSDSPEVTAKLTALHEVERAHILDVLQRTKWRVRGERGAAALLQLKPTTLESKMARLGISKPTKH